MPKEFNNILLHIQEKGITGEHEEMGKDLFGVCEKIATRLEFTESRISIIRTQIENLQKNITSGKADEAFSVRFKTLIKQATEMEKYLEILSQKLEMYYQIFEEVPTIDEVSDN